MSVRYTWDDIGKTSSCHTENVIVRLAVSMCSLGDKQDTLPMREKNKSQVVKTTEKT